MVYSTHDKASGIVPRLDAAIGAEEGEMGNGKMVILALSTLCGFLDATPACPHGSADGMGPVDSRSHGYGGHVRVSDRCSRTPSAAQPLAVATHWIARWMRGS